MRQYPEAMPLINDDPDSDPTTSIRIKSLDKAIHRDPELFIQALNFLEDEQTNTKSSTPKQSDLPRNISSNITDQIKEFFSHRDDLKISYDDETEKQIKSSEYHKQLIANARATEQSPTRIGDENPEAIRTRDAVRRSRLRLYIGHVAGYEAMKQINSHDSKESLLINT